MIMNLLYISEDYLNSKVHHQLCNSLIDNDEDLNITLFSVKRSGVKFKDLTDLYDNPKYTPVIEELKDSHFLFKYFFIIHPPFLHRFSLLLHPDYFSHPT